MVSRTRSWIIATFCLHVVALSFVIGSTDAHTGINRDHVEVTLDDNVNGRSAWPHVSHLVHSFVSSHHRHHHPTMAQSNLHTNMTSVVIVRALIPFSAKSFTMPSQYVELKQFFNAGFIVLSYIIAVVGSFCTLELLLRRTSNHGRSNILLLVFSGICFGAVSTFSMHFIGNNSLTLRHPPQPGKTYASLTLAYSAGFTILSLVVSCICMIGAFFIMGTDIDWDVIGRRLGLGKKRLSYGGQHHGSSSEDDESDMDMAFTLAAAAEDVVKTDTDHSPGTASPKMLKEDTKKAAIKSEMGKIRARQKVDNVMEKLEWALSWSMVDVPIGIAGGARKKREIMRRKAEDKATAIEVEEVNETNRNSPDPMPASDSAKEEVIGNKDNSHPDWDVVSSKLVLNTTAPHDYSLSPSPINSAVPLLNSRRGSDPTASSNSRFPPMHTAPASSFTPNFSFPQSVAAPLFPRDDQSPEYPSPILRYPPPSAIPSHVYGGGSGRRASLPTNALPGIGPRDYVPPSFKLARIQSLPDAEADAPPNTELHDQQMAAERQIMVDRALETVRARTHGYDLASAHMGKESSGLTVIREPHSSLGGSQGDDNRSNIFSSKALAEPLAGGSFPERNGRLKKRERLRLEKASLARWKKWLGWDVVTKGEIFKILTTGVIAGWGIAGMHYIGQRSINSIPYIAYNVGTVVGSVIIACGAVVIGLYIMFIILRPKLKHGWPVKIGVSLVLGAAVCLMHYVGMSGTHYGLIRGQPAPPSAHTAQSTKNAITGLVAGLAFICCGAISSFLIVAHIKMLRNKQGRRRVVLAAMIFDQEDRLLVGTDGILPMSDIIATEEHPRRRSLGQARSSNSWDANSSTSSVLHVDLVPSHPAFIAALRSTWAWRQPGVVPPTAASLPPASADGHSLAEMGEAPPRSTMDSTGRRGSTLSAMESASYPSMVGHQAPLAQNVSKFLERFNAAVGRLSSTVTGNEHNARRLGVLYDRMLTTGHVSISGTGSNMTVSKGQLVFLVRRLATAAEKTQLLARGFLFAEPLAVANVMAKALAVPASDLVDVMRDQRDFCDYGLSSGIKPGRLYTGVCIIQPTTFEGIQILVGRRRHALPMREICALTNSPLGIRSASTDASAETSLGTVEEIGEALTALQGQTLFDLMAPSLEQEDGQDQKEEDALVIRLRSALIHALIPMLDVTLTSKAMTKILPRLVITPYLIPMAAPLPLGKTPNSGNVGVDSMHTAWMIVFKAVLNVDGDYTALDWENWNLFRAQSECVSREGRSAHLMARLMAANAAVPSEELLQVRRPSKIQWNMGALPGLGDLRSESPIYNGVMSGLESSPKTSSASQLLGAGYRFGGDAKSSDAASELDAPGSPANSMKHSTHPRRSSLARGYNNQDTISLNDPPTVGVATWDPDWLARLLREDLYLRQDWDLEMEDCM